MNGSADQFAIRVRDLVVGFRQQIVIDHLSLVVQKAKSLAWSARPGVENPC
jgi:phospholipid/cholesterol/gamma-HCH transport system ATP-binding protein